MKIAVLGVGDMGQLHLAMYKDIINVEVAYIFGRDTNKLKEISNKFPVPYTTDIHDIYKDKSIIGVDICLPTKLHKEYVMGSLKAGKHVMSETPIAFDLKEAEQMIKTAKDFKKIFLVATLMPYVDEIKYVVEKVNSGDLGKPLSIYAYRFHPPYNVIDPIIELMSFELDTVLRILGMPIKTTAKLLEENHVVANLTYKNAQAKIEMDILDSEEYSLKHGIKIVCEKGEIETEIMFPKTKKGPPNSKIILRLKNGKEQIIKTDSHFPYKEECKYFVSCLSGESDGEYLSAEKSLNTLKTALSIIRSLN